MQKASQSRGGGIQAQSRKASGAGRARVCADVAMRVWDKIVPYLSSDLLVSPQTEACRWRLARENSVGGAL